MRHIAFFAIVALFAVPRLLAAQDQPRFGIVMGYPAELGVLWHVASRVAVRPEINWTKSSSETTTTVTTLTFNGPVAVPTTITSTGTSDTWQLGVGVSGLFYLSKGDALRTYISPRYLYSRSNQTIDVGVRSTIVPVATGPVTTVVGNHTASGALGAQYALGKRFGLFGELGLSYTHTGDRSSTPSPIDALISSPSVKSSTLALRSGAGVILFFGK
jgi:hypothetical protein